MLWNWCLLPHLPHLLRLPPPTPSHPFIHCHAHHSFRVSTQPESRLWRLLLLILLLQLHNSIHDRSSSVVLLVIHHRCPLSIVLVAVGCPRPPCCTLSLSVISSLPDVIISCPPSLRAGKSHVDSLTTRVGKFWLIVV